MSYGFTANIKQIIINGQNKTILTKETVSVPDEKTGNCRKTKDFPVAERCLKVYVIYPSRVPTTKSTSNKPTSASPLTF